MRVLRSLVSFALLVGISAGTETTTVRAAAADGCLPTNGLMNLNDADDLLAGTVRVTSSVTVDIGPGNVNWNRSSLGDGPARQLYSLKWVEELVREHRRSGDGRYLDRAVAIVLDFAADHPVGGGPDAADAWYPMHAGQRTTAIACVAAVTDHAGIDAALEAHARWLSGIVGGLDDWNQAIDPHLGLLMGGCDLGVGAWRDQARSGFASLVKTMIDEQGVLAEQTPGYGRFVWERWGAVEDQVAACGLTPVPDITQRRSALLTWLAWMSAPDGTTTPIGDAFRTVEPPTPAGSPTAYTVPGGTKGTAPDGTLRVFDAGYVVGRNSWVDLARSTYWTFRFGPGRDHHGHEDHTSVTFWVDGREVLIDSGHSGYGDATYRAALQSPEAHNVLVLPDVPPRLRTPAELVRSDSGPGWRFDEVSDDAYAFQDGGLRDAPRTRGVIVLPDDGVMVVQDRATRTTDGLFEQLWHLPPGAVVTSQTRTEVVARHPEGDVDIHVLRVPLPGQSRGTTSVVEGQPDPALGWFSEADGHRVPAPVVRVRDTGTSARMITVISTTPVGGDISTNAKSVDGGWTIELEADGLRRTIGVGVDGSMQVGAPDPVPVLTRGARRCLAVSGSPGDAAVVNLTPVLAGGDGFGVLVSSDVSGVPNASNVNYRAGSVDPNVAIAPIGADGRVCFQNADLTSVHLVADQLGTVPAESYEAATSSGAPRRLLDTREDGKAIKPGARRCLAVSGSPGDAAVVNLTPVLAGGDGFGVLVSSDVSGVPNASNVNYRAGSVDPNVAIAPIGADGRVCFQNADLTSVHLVADQLGTVPAESYEAATSSGAPRRLLDTREDGKAIKPGARRCLAVSGSPGDAAVVNLTPVLAGGDGFGVLVSSDVSGVPNASNVNYRAGSVDPNVAIAPIGADGRVCFQNADLTSVHLVADQLGTVPAESYEAATSSGAPRRLLDTRQS
ncbi:MAG: heparinase II/III family protein [Ilumatobacteraceae bacterium]|nr:heparinase II/III family protein [Ilumatobacteraceae bacterium]